MKPWIHWDYSQMGLTSLKGLSARFYWAWMGPFGSTSRTALSTVAATALSLQNSIS